MYNVELIPGRGQGFIAASKILRGTRILSEAPLFKVPRNEPNFLNVERIIERELGGLSAAQRQAFFSLHNSYGDSHSPSLGIARTNVLPLDSESHEGGLFLLASRINHSCRHNAQNTWNSNLGQITIHALRDIEEGMEITIAYLNGSPDYAERQRDLKRVFHFDCECELCSLPLPQRNESDAWLNMITVFDEAIEYSDEISSGLDRVRTMFLLFEREGIWDARIPRAYYDAFQIAIAGGDQARAKVFAERACAARTVIEGNDSPAVIRLQRLADECGEGNLIEDVPQYMSEEEFEDWLWMHNDGSSSDTPSEASSTSPGASRAWHGHQAFDRTSANILAEGDSISGDVVGGSFMRLIDDLTL